MEYKSTKENTHTHTQKEDDALAQQDAVQQRTVILYK